VVLCVLYFPNMQHTDELWLYMGSNRSAIAC
jgi:hypothetical protein